MQAKGLDSNKIAVVKDGSYRDYIAGLKQNDDQELLNPGLTYDEIKVLRSAEVLGDNGLSEDVLLRASANLAISIVPRLSNDTQVNYMIYWHWDTNPVFQLQDGVATAWSNGLIDDGTSTAVITYVTHNGGHQYESRLSYSNVAASPGMGMTFEFQMLETNSNMLHYAGAGRAFVALTGDVPATGVGISTKYGHNQIGGSFQRPYYNF